MSSDLFADLVPGTGAVSVSVGVAAAFDAASLLAALDRYPYRCSEQVTSRALPLLYLSDLAGGAHVALDPQTDQHIRDSIEALLTRQDSNGSFGLWSVGGNDVWLDSYVTDFLSRARERKYAVPDEAFKLALNRLRNAVAATTDAGKNGGDDIAYALYVLARNGSAPIGDLRYLADAKLDALSTPIAKAQIAAALAHGRRPRPGRARLCRRARFDRAAAAARYVRPRGLRLDPARRCRAGRARRRRRRAAGDGAGGGAAGRCRLRGVALSVDAGGGLASARRAGARQERRRSRPRRQRRSAAAPVLPHHPRRRSDGAACASPTMAMPRSTASSP